MVIGTCSVSSIFAIDHGRGLGDQPQPASPARAHPPWEAGLRGAPAAGLGNRGGRDAGSPSTASQGNVSGRSASGQPGEQVGEQRPWPECSQLENQVWNGRRETCPAAMWAQASPVCCSSHASGWRRRGLRRQGCFFFLTLVDGQMVPVRTTKGPPGSMILSFL